jgi:hypothetical protein
VTLLLLLHPSFLSLTYFLDGEGQHIYLHVPFLSAGGHPFTVSSIPSSNEDNDSISTQTMIIRVREGLTRRLFALPPSSPPTPTAYLPGTVWTEGPYGNQQYLDFYATLVLVAGGSGVSFTLPVMMDIVRRARGMWDATQRENGTGDAKEWNGDAVATLRLTFIWIIKKQGIIFLVSRFGVWNFNINWPLPRPRRAHRMDRASSKTSPLTRATRFSQPPCLRDFTF